MLSCKLRNFSQGCTVVFSACRSCLFVSWKLMSLKVCFKMMIFVLITTPSTINMLYPLQYMLQNHWTLQQYFTNGTLCFCFIFISVCLFVFCFVLFSTRIFLQSDVFQLFVNLSRCLLPYFWLLHAFILDDIETNDGILYKLFG